MAPQTFTQQKIEEVLNSLDGIAKADMPPFFYTRLQAKLETPAPLSNPFWLLLTKPAVTLATFCWLLVLNIAAINNYVKMNAQPLSPATGGVEGFAQEYNLTGPASIYTDKTARQ